MPHALPGGLDLVKTHPSRAGAVISASPGNSTNAEGGSELFMAATLPVNRMGAKTARYLLP